MGLYHVFHPAAIVVESFLFPLLAILLLVLRLVSRKVKALRLGVDDWLLLPATVFIVAMGIAALIGSFNKAVMYPTRPTQNSAAMSDQLKVTGAVYWNLSWMQPVTLGLIKLSFIFFYRRLFAVNTKGKAGTFNYISWTCIGLITAWMTTFCISTLFNCRPGHAAAFWNADTVEYCWSTHIWLQVYTWSDALTDLIVFFLPIPSVLGLHMTTRRKIAVIAVFTLGAIAVAASFLRAVFYNELIGIHFTNEATDPNILVSNAIFWILLESGLAIIAVNLPTLYGMTGAKGLQVMIRSIRSFTSLRSRQSSADSGKSDAAVPPAEAKPMHEHVYTTQIYGVDRTNDTWAGYASDKAESIAEGPEIRVTKTVDLQKN